MQLALISPPGDVPYELATVQALFAAGLGRYHLRKPGWDAGQVATWLGALPLRWHGRVFLCSHHALAGRLAVGGVHFPDRDSEETPFPGRATSRSCHDLATVRAGLGRHDSLLFGPVFASLSKPGYGPTPAAVLAELADVLRGRRPAEARTQVFAIGGVTAERVPACAALGFDGVAVLGGVWHAADPVAAFRSFASACAMSTPPSTSEVAHV